MGASIAKKYSLMGRVAGILGFVSLCVTFNEMELDT